MGVRRAEPPGQESADTLADALARYEIELSTDRMAELQRYCRLLWDWNRNLNLTRHTDYERFVTRDLVDSIQLSRLLHNGEDVLDIGSGGGVPGVVLAILRPDLRLSLCESVGKKATALQAIVEALELPAPVHHGRGERVLQELCFDAVVARAVGPLWRMLKWFQPHWTSIGRLLLVKGPRWVEERGEARHRGLLKNLELRRAAAYATPGTTAQNVILKIWPKASLASP
jgi:16S rRNA (guanine527-N7)-methyltransferase